MSSLIRLFQITAAIFFISIVAPAATAVEPVQASKAIWATDQASPLVPVSTVCCKRGWQDWWAPSWRRCRAAGGYVVHPSYCAVDYRVCCKRGLRDWWSPSARACYNSGGAPVHRRYCRFD